jgi:hypothetical protein
MEADRDQLETMLQIFEAFVHRNFILRHDVSKLKNAVRAKPKRRPVAPPISVTTP